MSARVFSLINRSITAVCILFGGLVQFFKCVTAIPQWVLMMQDDSRQNCPINELPVSLYNLLN